MTGDIFMRRIALAGAAAIGLTPSGYAADLPTRVPVKAAPAAPAYDWTGFYVGAHAGWGWGSGDTSQTYLPSPQLVGLPPISYNSDPNGFLAGGQIGFNRQTGIWVLGVEGDISYTGIAGRASVAPLTSLLFPGVPIPGTSNTSSSDINWFATLRARLGITPAAGWLVYVTGGLAVADIDYSVFTDLGSTQYAGSASKTKVGWTVGGGFEWGLGSNWSVKAEYLYYDLGDTTVIGDYVPGFIAHTVTTFENTGHIARLGINYHFGWGGGPR
jgi:outer membrane immunogenic protein